MNWRRASKGFTLVECLVASFLLGLAVLTLFRGVSESARMARSNSDILAAEAVAWDAVWVRFNEDFDALAVGEVRQGELSAEASPELARYDTPPVLKVWVSAADAVGFSASPLALRKISADVEWGPAGRRRSLSSVGQVQSVFRSALRRAPQ